MPASTTVMPRACARSMIRARFCCSSSGGRPRRPSFPPSATIRTRTSPSSDHSRFRPQIDAYACVVVQTFRSANEGAGLKACTTGALDLILESLDRVLEHLAMRGGARIGEIGVRARQGELERPPPRLRVTLLR